jgi:hypothetical protein
MHLQGLDQEVPVVPTIGTRERHLSGTPLDSYKVRILRDRIPLTQSDLRKNAIEGASRAVPGPRFSRAQHKKYSIAEE